MHELGIMQGVVRVCMEEQARRGFSRVERIVLSVGAVSGIVPECLERFFPAAARGTVAEGAKLITHTIPAGIECPECGYSGEIHGSECPGCGGWAYRLTQGCEFYIDSLEVE